MKSFWYLNYLLITYGRSRKGAWIEIFAGAVHVTTVYGRSRKGAWIEMAVTKKLLHVQSVAPARERGLKCVRPSCCAVNNITSLPQGSVD